MQHVLTCFLIFFVGVFFTFLKYIFIFILGKNRLHAFNDYLFLIFESNFWNKYVIFSLIAQFSYSVLFHVEYQVACIAVVVNVVRFFF